jgi:hypothetical protein
VQPLEREGRAGTVADESLDAGTVLGLDAHGGALPHAMHASRGGPASTLNLAAKNGCRKALQVVRQLCEANPPEPCQVSMPAASSLAARLFGLTGTRTTDTGDFVLR